MQQHCLLFLLLPAPQDSGPVPMPDKLDKPMTGIRYVKLIFPEGTFSNSSALMRDLLCPMAKAISSTDVYQSWLGSGALYPVTSRFALR